MYYIFSRGEVGATAPYSHLVPPVVTFMVRHFNEEFVFTKAQSFPGLVALTIAETMSVRKH